jgi:hypothetical protein
LTQTQIEGAIQSRRKKDFISLQDAQEEEEEEKSPSMQQGFHTSLTWYQNPPPCPIFMAIGTLTFMATSTASRAATE